MSTVVGQDTSRSGGIALLDKPPGVTSHDALAAIKRELGTRRVGHTGTLDRFATGLLVVLSGECTPLAPLFEHLDKTYVARALLGVETDTLDPEGQVVATANVPDREQLLQALPAFRGEILQTPPAYSAIHVGGVRAHHAARSGRPPTMQPRAVSILELEILDYSPPLLELKVRCGKGAYIRALARDLALAVSSRAHLVALRRTALGDIGVGEAVAPDTFRRARDLHPPAIFFREHTVTPRLSLTGDQVVSIRQGRPIRAAAAGEAPAGTLLCMDPSGEPVALAAAKGGEIRPIRVLGGGP